jgi:hypothetical protein
MTNEGRHTAAMVNVGHPLNGGARVCSAKRQIGRLQFDVNVRGLNELNNENVNDDEHVQMATDVLPYERDMLKLKSTKSTARRKQIRLHEHHVEPTTFRQRRRNGQTSLRRYDSKRRLGGKGCDPDRCAATTTEHRTLGDERSNSPGSRMSHDSASATRQNTTSSTTLRYGKL